MQQPKTKLDMENMRSTIVQHEETVDEFIVRISEAKRNARNIARTIADIICKDGMHYATDEFEKVQSQLKLTVAESVMFRSLIHEEVKSIVVNSKNEDEIAGIPLKELMAYRGYTILILEADKEYSWRYGTLTDAVQSSEVFSTELLAIEDVIAHYKKAQPTNTATTSERVHRNTP